MSSRRPMTRSFSDGRSSSYNGDDVSGSSRASSCSYLSSVRPENSHSSHRYSQYSPSRSTLCSVMAHLTEETQPLFETTLRSRAVSETSNVKFTCLVSGYPAPEVTWYKDDTQLDRYCGLPKYKVFRDGQDHSLHIYNCTEEDAAIYQASARNSKGIVSCSGVLEVGTMSEYKIHQQYFAKLKKKAENKRRALEESRPWDEENHGPGPQEQLRTISPDRSQRKRRSPMEASLSAPSSMEDEEAEVNPPALVPGAEARLQETAVDGEEKPIPTTNGAAPYIPNGQAIKENGSKGITYIYDSMQKTFIAHPPKAPFAKKKIKISNGVESVKGDSLAEMASEERVTSGGASAVHSQEDSLHAQGSVDEVMEVESSAPDHVKEAEQEEKVSLSNAVGSVGKEKVQMERTLHRPSHKEQPLSLSASSDVPSPTKDISGTKSENGVEQEKVLEVEPKNIVGCQEANLTISSQPKPSSSITNTTVEIKSYPEDVTVMEVDEKPSTPELIQKPSTPELIQKPSTPELIQKPSTPELIQKPSTPELIQKPSTPELIQKPSTPKLIQKPSTPKLIQKPSTPKLIQKPSTPELIQKPSTPELIQKPSTPELIQKPSTPELIQKPSTPELIQKPSALGSMKSTNTLVNKAKAAVKDSAPVVAPSSDASINGNTLSRVSESTATPCDRETVLPQRLSVCEQTGDQLSGKETSSSRKNVSVSGPPLPGEVTQAHTQTGRNDAPVDLKSLTTRSELDARLPQRPTLERGATTDADQTPTLHNPSQSASDEMTQGTWDHSRGSNESHTVPSTDLLKSPLESPGDSDNKSGCNVSPTLQQGQVEIAIKTLGGTEIPVDKNVQGNEIGERQVQIGNFASVGRKIDVDTEVGSFSRIHQDDVKRTDAPEKEKIDNIVLDVKMEKNGQVVPRTLPLNLNLEAVTDKSQIADLTSVPNPNSQHNSQQISAQQTKDLKVVPKPDPVMSIAEILRAQMKALASTVNSSAAPIVPMHVSNQNVDHRPTPSQLTEIQNSVQGPAMRMEETDYSKDSGKPKLKKEIDTNIGSISAANVVLRHDKVEPHSCTESKLLQSSNIVSPVVETLPNKFVIPPISIIDIENTFKNRTPIIVKDNDSVMDTGQEPGTSLCPPLENSTDSLTGKNSMDSSLITTSIPPVNISQEHKQDQGNTIEDMDSSWSVPPKVSSQHMVSLPQENSKAISSLPCDSKKHSLTERPDFPLNMTPTVSLVSDVKNVQPDSAMLLDPLEEHTLIVPQRNPQITLDTPPHTPTSQPNSTTSSEIKVEDYSKIDPLIPTSSTDESPLLRKKEDTSPIPSATPQELALGARRKIFLPKPKGEDMEATPPADSQPQREEVLKKGSRLSPENPSMSPSLSRKTALLQPPSGQSTPPAERRSPLLNRRKVAPGAPEQIQEPVQRTETTRTEEKPEDKDKHKQFKAPQVIRKIRGEPFSDASGHLKLWCQFFNVLSDSTIKWYRDEVEISEVKKSAEDETQVALAIVQTSSRDCGVYGCTITNEYGTDSTDFLLSFDILAGMFLREDPAVGEEIEMTQLVFNKGLADSGLWGNKLFGRIMMTENHLGEGCSHKACRVKVIYGLEPVFESGTTGIIKVRSPIAYGDKGESNLLERNQETTQLECRIQNIAREYCKIFAAETRVIENFGPTLEVIPRYLMYRPANTIPHATVEADLKGVYLRYCLLDATGRLIMRTGSEVEQKCCALQHWIHQWTNGNLLLTRLEGVDTKITNVGISIKSKGYQGLTPTGNPKVFEQFISQHQCNYYCGLLKLRTLKTMDSLQTPVKTKSSRSPLLQRKTAPGSSSPQMSRKATTSPRISRKSESEDSKATSTQKGGEAPKSVG